MLYWETAQETSLGDDQVEFARLWKALPKVVFSTTLERVTGYARLVRDGVGEEIARLKAAPGKDIAVGGAGLAGECMRLGLLDEWRVKMKCPRRQEGPFKLSENDQYTDDDTCSYCGSLNPDTLMARLELGDIELGPTDKNYKIYVENKEGPKFKRSYRQGCDMGKPGSKCTGPEDCIHRFTEERDHSKFYFQHLSEDQMKRFIDLLNDKKIKIGYPGYFYVRPFFVAPSKVSP